MDKHLATLSTGGLNESASNWHMLSHIVLSSVFTTEDVVLDAKCSVLARALQLVRRIEHMGDAERLEPLDVLGCDGVAQVEVRHDLDWQLWLFTIKLGPHPLIDCVEPRPKLLICHSVLLPPRRRPRGAYRSRKRTTPDPKSHRVTQHGVPGKASKNLIARALDADSEAAPVRRAAGERGRRSIAELGERLQRLRFVRTLLPAIERLLHPRARARSVRAREDGSDALLLPSVRLRRPEASHDVLAPAACTPTARRALRAGGACAHRRSTQPLPRSFRLPSAGSVCIGC
mmetsp:Transcript_23123/g.76047  ORF Transcript_23123/g.76047 Transcript_23123/m.76047 type:complete len:288 (-) Transcript_23123:1383-2246(-)